MTSNTQDNTGDRARGSFDTNAGLGDNDPSLGSHNGPSSGLEISGSEGDQSIGQGNLGTGIESGTETGYGSSQQQYDQGTATGQYDSTRSREEGGADSEQKQYGLGQEAGVGHHKTHQEGHLHKHGSDEAAQRDQSAGCTQLGQDSGCTQLGQDSGIGAGTTDTSPLDPRLDEQTGTGIGAGTTDTSPLDPRLVDEETGTGAGTTGYSTGAQPGYLGDTTGADVPTTGSNTGTDNQYLADTTQAEHHHHKHQDDSYDTGVKPKVMDKVIGGVEKAAGKLTSDPDLYRRGAQRATGGIQKN